MAQALFAWVRDVGAEPGGDLREVYLCFSAEADLKLRGDYLAGSAGEFVTELQIPMVRSDRTSAGNVLPESEDGV